MIKLSTSMMCANYFSLESQIKIIDSYTDYYHIDVMDGNYVENIALSVDYIKQLKEIAHKPIDVHLMVNNPLSYIDKLINIQVNSICVHEEVVLNSIFRLIDKIKKNHIKFGLAISPSMRIDTVEILLPYIDKLTIMTVEPGFAGQQMIKDVLPKIEILKELKTNNNYSYVLEIDGSNNFETFNEYVNRGAEQLILGSALFNNNNIEEGYVSIRNYVDSISACK